MYKNNEIEVSYAKYMEGEEKVRSEYVKACMGDDDLFINTKGLRVYDAETMCSIQYRKDRDSILENESDELTESQNNLPESVKAAVGEWKELEKTKNEAEDTLRSRNSYIDYY